MEYPFLVMTTNDAAIAGGAQGHGWVSGTPSALAAAAAVNCVFDLGAAFPFYHYLHVNVTPAGGSSGLSVDVYGSPDTTHTHARATRLSFANAVALSTGTGSIPTAGGTQGFSLRPAGRYVIVRVTNSDGTNAVGAGAKVVVSAYP